jgi:hypothetical protein
MLKDLLLLSQILIMKAHNSGQNYGAKNISFVILKFEFNAP